MQEFPKLSSNFLSAASFQDTGLILTFRGWEKIANEDRPARGRFPATTWKQTLKYALKYSYPEFAIDEAGEQRLDKNGQPFKNSNYDPEYPHGYTVAYLFEEGRLESGSLPLFRAFCALQPKVGEVLLIGKTGKDKETKWTVQRASKVHPDDVPEINLDAPEYSGDPLVNPKAYEKDEQVPF